MIARSWGGRPQAPQGFVVAFEKLGDVGEVGFESALFNSRAMGAARVTTPARR